VLYDNGVGNHDLPDDEETSRAVRYVLDEATMQAEQVWEDDGEPFFSPVAGDVDRLPNGHLQVLDSTIVESVGFDGSQARIRELDPRAAPMQVWLLQPPVQQVIYRVTAHDRLVGLPAR
jgi:hypothetical protein